MGSQLGWMRDTKVVFLEVDGCVTWTERRCDGWIPRGRRTKARQSTKATCHLRGTHASPLWREWSPRILEWKYLAIHAQLQSKEAL